MGAPRGLYAIVAQQLVDLLIDNPLYHWNLRKISLIVPNRSRNFWVTPRDKVMSTCSWHGDALMAGRSRRGDGNDSYCDAGPQLR